jgi:hypothetical protein
MTVGIPDSGRMILFITRTDHDSIDRSYDEKELVHKRQLTSQHAVNNRNSKCDHEVQYGAIAAARLPPMNAMSLRRPLAMLCRTIELLVPYIRPRMRAPERLSVPAAIPPHRIDFERPLCIV